MRPSTASGRPRTSRRLRMRDIHVIYADSNSAGFKNRLLESVQTQQERDRQTRLERRRQQERERRARETPEERDRRRSLRNQRDRERRRARCASALAQLERVCTCTPVRIIIRIRIYYTRTRSRSPPNVQHFTSLLCYMHILYVCKLQKKTTEVVAVIILGLSRRWHNTANSLTIWQYILQGENQDQP